MIRLNKRMADLGLCSRREADEWIKKGCVWVNGQQAILGLTVTEHDHIVIEKKALEHQQKQVTLVLHKPLGYVSTQPEDNYHAAIELIQADRQWKGASFQQRFHVSHRQGLSVAGRLDIDSTGLLLFTQDGRIARQVIGEERKIEKEYRVRVCKKEGACENIQSAFPLAQLQLLRHGLSLDGKALLPAKVNWTGPDQLQFILKEGKKRQIRRMCEEVGLHVVALKRTRIGKIQLDRLPIGQWRYLHPHETLL